MGDFHQTGVVSTLHRFRSGNLARLEEELERFSAIRPITLILPTLYGELQRPALRRIVEELKQVKYLHQIVVALGGADRDGFQNAKRFFAVLPQNVRIIWTGGERIGGLFEMLARHKLEIGPDGKGRSVWLALGYTLAEGGSHLATFHDCDIINYDRELLARLCYPVANPNLNYEFSKGYYNRVTDRFYGRVTRLFITPLIRAMEKTFGYSPVLVYLDSFRYPLAGEFALTMELARNNRIQGDWGLDFGVLAEVFRNCSIKRICQVDLIDSYEHKHQNLSESDPGNGLFKMSIDIARVFCRTMASEGAVFSDGALETLLTTYMRFAQDIIKVYQDSASINHISFDRQQEDLTVKTFAEGLRIGGNSFLQDPLGNTEIPNWNRVASAIPEFLPMLKEIVESED